MALFATSWFHRQIHSNMSTVGVSKTIGYIHYTMYIYYTKSPCIAIFVQFLRIYLDGDTEWPALHAKINTFTLIFKTSSSIIVQTPFPSGALGTRYSNSTPFIPSLIIRIRRLYFSLPVFVDRSRRHFTQTCNAVNVCDRFGTYTMGCRSLESHP